MVVGAGLISLKSYFIPKSLAESVSKKGIRLNITAYEARSKYSYAKMRSVVTIFKFMPKYTVEHRVFYDRFHTLRYNITRNRLAAGIAFLSGILLLISGYKATLLIYQIITQEILLHTTQEFWMVLLFPLRILAIIQPAWRNYRAHRSRLVCCKQGQSWKILFIDWNRPGNVHHCLPYSFRDIVIIWYLDIWKSLCYMANIICGWNRNIVCNNGSINLKRKR